MDFECLDFMKGILDLSQYDEANIRALRTKASKFKLMHNRIYYIRKSTMLLVPTIAERKLLVQE